MVPAGLNPFPSDLVSDSASSPRRSMRKEVSPCGRRFSTSGTGKVPETAKDEPSATDGHFILLATIASGKSLLILVNFHIDFLRFSVYIYIDIELGGSDDRS